MSASLPDGLLQGESARLFPVLSDTSKEGRSTSILLSCMTKVDELGRQLLASAGQRLGTRAKLEAYTEIVLSNCPGDARDRPDGLLVVRKGSQVWRALVEAKVAGACLDAEQIERYRQTAKENGIDCVITISNQFATTPASHPLEAVRKSRSKIPVFHWSWMHVLTMTDLLLSRDEVADSDQMLLLNELRRFLSHDSAGVKGFDRMPREWTELNKLVASGGDFSVRSAEAQAVIDAWHQETRDLSLILSRMTEARVDQRLTRVHISDPARRSKDELTQLCEQKQLGVSLEIPGAAAPIDVTVDLARRSVDTGMTLRAPDDKKSTKARLNWLLRQIKNQDVEDLHVRLFWPGRSPTTQHAVADLRPSPEVASDGKGQLAPTKFHIFTSKFLGARFTQRQNFILDVESLVPDFYKHFGAHLKAWQKPAPKIKDGRDDAEQVSTGAISDHSETFETQ